MFKSTTCDKLPARIFENFEIAQVKQWQFENFQKSWRWFIPQIAQIKHVATG